MIEPRRYLIPTWVLVVVLVAFGVPNAVGIWAKGGIGNDSPDPTVRFLGNVAEISILLPAWFALGMLIRRVIRRPHTGD